MTVRLAVILAISSLAGVAAAEIPRVDQRPHRVEYDPSTVAGGVLRQPLALSKLEPKKPHTVFFKSFARPTRLYARDPATGKTLAEGAAYHQLKDSEGRIVYVSRLGLKAFTPDAELVVQLDNAKLRWGMLLFCDGLVVNGNDSGPGSLRGELAATRNSGSVCFDPLIFDVPTAPVVALQAEILVGQNVDVHGTTRRPTIDAAGRDRALHFGLGTDVTMHELWLEHGHAGDGGLIYARGRLELDRVLLVDALADADGGAIYVDGGQVTLRASGVADSEAQRGGGVFAAGGEVRLFASSVSDNVAVEGGGVHVRDGVLMMHDGSWISGNEATDGAGLYLSDTSYHGTHYLWGGTIGSNRATRRGGGVYLDGATMVIELVGGRSPSSGQAVDGNVAAEEGGGVYVTLAGSMTVQTGNRIASNLGVLRGGAVYNAGHVRLQQGSGIEFGYAGDGAGVYNTGILELDGASRIGDCFADGDGGGVYNADGAELHVWDRASRIEDNAAGVAGPNGTGGGVLNVGTGFVDVLSTVIVDNQPNDLVNRP